MVLLLPRAGLHAMLSEVQVSTQHVIAVMLVNVSRSPEVALDALQRSVLVSASGNTEHFNALIQCGYYHHGVSLPLHVPVPWMHMSIEMVIFLVVPFFGHV